MWKLERPSIELVKEELDDALDDFEDDDPLAPTKGEKDALFELYVTYETSLGRPKQEFKGENLRAHFHDLVYAAYGQVTDAGRLSRLRSALKLGARECPYCGFGQIEDLDHHLRKKSYKLFSIFPLNLIPSCATCNRKKPKKDTEDPAEDWLNVYLEDVAQSEFLVATASLTAEGALAMEFTIAAAGAIQGEMLERIRNQFERLDLQARLQGAINIYLGSLEVAFNDNYEAGGAEAVRSFLIRSADKNEERLGKNDWRTAVLRALAACPAFCGGGFKKALGSTG